MIREVAGYAAEVCDDACGWLTPAGCRLGTGRPPLCYDFICNAIHESLKSPDRHQTLRQIARLMSFAGERALDGRHLVTLSEKQIFEKFDFDRLVKRIAFTADILHRLKGAPTIQVLSTP